MKSLNANVIEVFKALNELLRTKYFVVIAEVFLLTVLTLSAFSILVRLTNIETIGLWVLLNSLLSFSKMADFWSAGLVTFVAEYLERGNVRKAGQLVSTSMVTAAAGFLVLVLVVGSGLSLFASHIPGVENTELVRQVIPLMCSTFWLTAVAATYQVGFLGFNRPALKFLQNVGGSLVFLVLSIILVPQYGLWGILYAQALQGFLMLSFGVTVFHGFVTKTSPLYWNATDFKRLTGYGSKAAGVGILQLACDPLIRLLASHFGGLAAVTLMELATRMIVAVRGLIMSVGQLLVPAFARAAVLNQGETERLYLKARKIFLLVTLPVMACLLSVAPLLERVMLVNSSSDFLPMMWLLGLGWSANIITAPAFFLLTGRRRLRPLFWNRLLMLLSVLIFGILGGSLSGVLGVTIGVSIGLTLASIVVFQAAREFEPVGGLTSGLDLKWTLICPLFFAALSNGVFLWAAYSDQPLAILAAITALGLTATFLVALVSTPLKQLARGALVNAELPKELI